jgi:hypothetical protein
MPLDGVTPGARGAAGAGIVRPALDAPPNIGLPLSGLAKLPRGWLVPRPDPSGREATRRFLACEAAEGEARRYGLPQASPDVIRRARVIPRGDRFDFADETRGEGEGEPALVFLARDERGSPCDLVAWRPEARWLGNHDGRAWALGLERLNAFRFTGPEDGDGACPVFLDPRDWLRASRDGLVIVDAGMAARLLADGPPLVAQSREDARALERALDAARPRPVIGWRAAP